MKIGIIGSGNMGRSLGLVWAERGHDVFFGGRDPQVTKAAAERAAQLTGTSKATARHGTNAEAARFGDLLLYTARGVPPAEALGEDGASALANKIVVDLNNQKVPNDFVFPPIATSLAERLAAAAPGAKVVKAFNTMAQETFELCPEAIRPYRVAAFVAGDDPAARATVKGLAEEIGFVPVDCGPLVHARLLEGAADLIRFLMIRQKMADANFSLIDVPDAANPRLGGHQPSKIS
ncbi:MAG TPA: NAD(P)-binding domain-containing protein [Chthoniobacterales bacterium]